ncbi:MAG TPA: hypothetical protein DCR04_01825 [Flavobacteriales bacterium]|nr:hypothetical protein [Flavobacteriales bacterium]
MRDSQFISPEDKSKNRIATAAGLVISIHVLGVFFPEQMWGAHYLSFLPGWLMLALIGFSISGITLIWNSTGEVLSHSNFESEKLWERLCWIIPLLAGAFANLTPIFRDVYGDSYYIAKELEVLVKEWTPEMTAAALNYDPFVPKEGIRTFYSLANFLGYAFEISSATVIKYLQVFLIIVFNWLWLRLVTKSCKGFNTRIVLAVVGFLVPVGLVFHQHYETYALPLTLFMGFVLLLKVFFEKREFIYLVALIVYLIIGLKFHISFWLLSPALILATLFFLSNHQQRLNAILKPKTVLWLMVVPGILLVAAIYLWKGSVNGTRLAPPDNLYDALFVTTFPLEAAPYDRYKLFGFSHICDYFQVLFNWSPISWFLIIVAVLSKKFKSSLTPFNLTLLVVFVAMLCWFFILNPLLGMSADWDLFSFPAIILMAIGAQLFASMETEKWAGKLGATALCLSLLNIPVFMVNASQSMLSDRYEALFRNDFKHFWIGSSTLFEVAAELESNPVERLQRQTKVINDMKPYAIPNRDLEYAEVLRQTGISYGGVGDFSRALELHKAAESYQPNLKKNIFDMIVVYFKLNRPAEALPYLDRHIANQYPSRRKATLMAIHVSIAAGDYNRARFYCSSFLQQSPEDKFILTVFNVLNSGIPSEAIKFFAKS